MNKSVAIDGPAGAGKSTLARRLAQRLGFLYVDTGAIYRTVGLYTLRNRLAPEEVVPMLEKLDIRMEYDSGGVQRMRLNGEDVSEAIRVHEVSQRASQVAALPEKYRLVLYLPYYQGYATDEIAQILRQNPSTVRSWLLRARKKLKLRLEAEGYGPQRT